jgi:hypothetical protein
MTGYEYYTTLEEAVRQIDTAIGLTEKEAAGADEFSGKNYSEMLYGMNRYKGELLRKLAAHRYAKMSKEDFIFRNDNSAAKTLQKTHVVKSHETGLTIAKLYGTTLEAILKKNNITTDEITAGKTLRIEVTPASEVVQVYDNIPTYGSQAGMLVFGKDLPDKIEAVSGEFKVLEPLETLRQGLTNRMMTARGEYPLEDDFGVTEMAGKNFPEELSDSMFLVEVQSQLEQDGRISSIDAITIRTEGTAKIVEAKLTAVTGAEVNL